MKAFFALVGSIAFCASAIHAQAEQAQPGKPRLKCESAAIKAPADTTITSVRTLTAPVAYCRVDGYVTTNNPGPNKVGFMAAMPESWNGRYLMSVPGGAAGKIGDPPEDYLRQGYAIASTDKGTHAAHSGDFSWQQDPGKNTDYQHRGVHVSAVASQAVVRDYYGRQKVYRYITGCSGGGRGTISEAEWYPEDADVFVPGAFDTDGGSFTFWGYVARHLHADPKRWISEAEMKRVADAIMKEYDASDGAIDGLIWDPKKIVLKRQLFPFISDAQFSTLEILEKGLPVPKGVDHLKGQGFWMSNPTAIVRSVLGTTPPPWTPETQPGLFTIADTSARAQFGPNYNIVTDLDFGSAEQMEKQEAATRMGLRVPGSTTPKNLEKIQKTGSKMIMYVGAAESAAPPENITDYTDLASELYGPGRANWFRTFVAPGLGHCAGGEGAPTDFPEALLKAAEVWAEQGKAPDYVIASNPSIGRTYRICSYPEIATFNGGVDNPKKLDVKDAANWTCRKP